MSEIRSQATPARDELAAYLDRVIDNEAWANTGAEAAKHIEEQLGWSKPRTVNNAAELDALPVGSVVWTPALVGPVGHIFVKCAGMWIIPWHDTAEDPLEQNGSVTVLFTPGDMG
ncbi:hypothetical protein G9444_2505 [Rhodococcus erythropolis]|uniref:Uncharacterized protein n=1 Tax=Rhodococcus erythropolis TaxID=1833 RepID=A0A6G9CSR9_RHOER|nr:hypothetical protein [Rhodococcus erythropolis]QIP39691.1 hypothetical protein G9444_2447 [Rhodococcus erythropolis]QIP39749.1 hypothetical protein G9444_2505 [Rhodococcus erythropolis]